MFLTTLLFFDLSKLDVSGCPSIKNYEHYIFQKHCINDLRTVHKYQKVFLTVVILRPLGSPSWDSFLFLKFQEKIDNFYKKQCIILQKGEYSKVSNAERIVKIFRLRAEI